MVVDRRFAYVLSDDQIAQGSTLGAPRCCVIVKPTGAIERVYCPDAGFAFFGSINIRLWDRRSGVRLSSRDGEFHFHPERQDHIYELDNGVYYRFHFRNDADHAVSFGAYGFCELRGDTARDVAAEFDRELGGIVAWNTRTPSQVRLFATLAPAHAWETSDDRGMLVARTAPPPLANAAAATGANPVGALHVQIDLAPGEDRWVEFLCVLSAKGRDDLKAARRQCPPGKTAVQRTTAYYWNYLQRSVIQTPDRDVNQGVLWAKANMLRVQTYAPTGWCFTNDPTRSNNSVGRDTAWMSIGADFLNPGFARDSLHAYFQLQQPSGKIVEYYDVRNGASEDYGLNVNDNTPLVVIALAHHYAVTGNDAFLRECYPGAVRAMDYMLSQRNEQGLVWCTSTKTANWGIVGWRNVIRDYRISGASTEVNSECYAALKALVEMARLCGDEAAMSRYGGAAEALREAINTHLVNPLNDLYYLTIDVDGALRSDITSDLLFPVLFGVAPPERAARIIGALSDAAFWTDAGMRTAPRDDLIYGPTNGYGLLGGVWVAVTFWYARAAAKYSPTLMAKALAMSFRHFSRDPRRNNTVPGQFSEWLHGEILSNQGMMLSPWDAPRYLWAAIEGAAGLEVHWDEAKINPALAAEWRWLVAVNVPFRGGSIAWIAMRMPDGLHVHTTASLGSDAVLSAYERDITSHVQITDANATLVAFANQKRTMIFVGNSGARTVTTAVSFNIAAAKARARVFSTVWNTWQDLGNLPASKITDGIVLIVDAGGFALVEIT
jgi:hypothetical protein